MERLMSRPRRLLENLTRPVAQASAARHDYRKVPLPEVAPQASPNAAVSWSLRVAAAWSWRSLVVLAAVAVFGYALYSLQIVVVPVLVALLLTVILQPVNRLLRKILPDSLAAGLSLLVGLGVVSALLSLASTQIVYNIYGLTFRAELGFNQLVDWLSQGPLKLEESQVKNYLGDFQAEVFTFLQSNSRTLASGAITATASIGTLVTGLLITLFCVFFFLKDGRGVWVWFLRLLPSAARLPVHEASLRGWITLGSYARTQIVVAAIDSASIGVVAYLIGVPLAMPLAVIIFLGSLIPIVGIIVTGALATLVVLFDSGPWMALAMVIIIFVAYMVEGSLLQPLLMSGAVNLHPVAVLLAVTAGGYLASIPGALFAVPVVAFINTVVLYLHGYDKFPRLVHDPNRPGGSPQDILDAIAGSRIQAQEEACQAARDAGVDEADNNAEGMALTSVPSDSDIPEEESTSEGE